MSLVSAFAIYFIIWWVTLFTVLPIGVRSQKEANEITLGTEHGAPLRTQLPRKALITTVLATAIFAVYYYIFVHSGLGLEDVPFLPDFRPQI